MSAQIKDLWKFDCIPTIQDGETLFSWCSLYHRLSGTKFAQTTSKLLFNSTTGGFVVDFPGRLDFFVRVTGGLIGDTDQIIDLHTLLRLYSKFNLAITTNKTRTMMREANVGRLKFILGLPSSRANAYHPLKFCRRCVEEEVKDQGFARWWVGNQWPTVWMCEKHSQLLDCAKYGISEISRIAWLLPSDLKQNEIAAPPLFPLNTLEKLTKLARLTTTISNIGEEPYTPEILTLTFLSQIKKCGWVSANGRIKYADVRDAFLAECIGFEQLYGFEFIQSLHQPDYGFLGTALRRRSRYLHPSKYLLMILFLFVDYETFIEQYSKYSNIADINGERVKIIAPDREYRDRQLRQMILDKKLSLNQSAGLMDMSITSVIEWAKHNKIQYKRRPRLETQHLLEEIKDMISKGTGRQEMAEKLGVRRRWLIIFFARNPDLHANWIRNHQVAMLQIRRAAFRVFINEHQGIPINKLLAIPGNGYKWLLKHDRQWLANNMPLVSS